MSNTSGKLSRLQKALSRQGIQVSFQDNIYQIHNEQAAATILLPDSLPLEHKAVSQLLDFASVADPGGHGVVCKACATPDFHPGSIAPVGSVVATSPDFVIPAAIGTDINCGIRLMTTGLNQAQAELHKSTIVDRLTQAILKNGRDVPVRTAGFKALFDDGPSAFVDELPALGLWQGVDRDRLQAELSACVGLQDFGGQSRYAPEALLQQREVVRPPSAADLGSGNHFLEFCVVDEIYDRHAAYAAGLRKGDVTVMIHTGSRDVGFYVGRRWMDLARQQWPQGVKHPQHGLYGLSGALARDYLQAMGVAARYAWFNRMALAELVRQQLADMAPPDASRLIVDVPHNVVMSEGEFNVHRKGSTPAHADQWALIPGSMGDYSFLVKGLGNEDWLQSCSHGAGRQVRRQDTRRMKQPLVESVWQCITLREERLIEEAPSAYKPVGPVLQAQEEAGLIRASVRLKPWLTFKA
ncbi:RtcB family protein [Comamonas resistens]|uniref:tRNA-splicing ligase RtcB n=1 Tax=Comamonas resistens TaxID=3046670 RepID=A0ABY8SY62_9BURK|nr:RtcB family protein [Comamonas resistens]MDL5037804.1 RtcB family protein [Comamonas resistens]WHS67621.1 RtcB family protein [Comamonas resistens]